MIQKFFFGNRSHHPNESLDRQALLLFISYTGVSITLTFSIIAYIDKNYIYGHILLGQALIFIVSNIFLKRTGRYNTVVTGMMIEFALFLLFLLISGGSKNTGPLWYYVFPPVIIYFLGEKRGVRILCGLIVVSIIIMRLVLF